MRWVALSLIIMNLLLFGYDRYGNPFEGDEFNETSVMPSNNVYVSRDADGDEVKLLSEASQTSKTVLAVDEGKSALNKTAKSSSRLQASDDDTLCISIGPFASVEDARLLMERLKSYAVEASLKNKQAIVDHRYWLYLEPELSRRAALLKLEELQARGIDSYIIPSGALEHGISLGIFSQKKSALGLMAQIGSQGYNPKIQNIKREVYEAWVFVEPDHASLLSDDVWEELSALMDSVQVKKSFCSNSLASKENIL